MKEFNALNTFTLTLAKNAATGEYRLSTDQQLAVDSMLSAFPWNLEPFRTPCTSRDLSSFCPPAHTCVIPTNFRSRTSRDLYMDP